jgi:hypothetical protein
MKNTLNVVVVLLYHFSVLSYLCLYIDLYCG